MKATVGIAGLEELFADIPEKFRLNRLPDIPPPFSEQETIAAMRIWPEKYISAIDFDRRRRLSSFYSCRSRSYNQSR